MIADILDTARWQPIILVSCAGDTRKPRIDIAELSDKVAGAAKVVTLNAGASWALQAKATDAFNVYGGATRVVFPDAHLDDPLDRHPLFLVYEDDDPARTVNSIVATLRRRGFLEAAEPAAPQPDRTGDAKPAKLRDAHRTITRLRRERDQAVDRLATADTELADLRRQARRLAGSPSR